MKEKELKILIKKGLQDGVSKSDLYEDLKDKYEDDDSLRLILASNPTLENRKNYKFYHLVLSVIWGIFLAIELLNILELIEKFDLKLFISLILSFYLTINIWKLNGKFLLPGIIWFIFTIFNAFISLSDIPEYDPDFYLMQNLTFGYVFILIIGIILMYYLRKNVFEYFKLFTPEKNKSNQTVFE
ncbi:hypothetical protein ACNI3T_00345 [Christiangramia sp. ASW11-125]|uniref:hypothetical protein n=1 Tax=Christiangramia sp. ASW11-125 TaxID=3400701 RepID=UPI003AAFFA79